MNETLREKLPLAICVLAVLVLAGRFLFGGSSDASLTSIDPNKRLIALEGLWHSDSDKARENLRKMTADPDERVVLQSIRGMGHNRDSTNRQQLQSFTAVDRPPLFRREALAALGNYEDVPVAQFVSVLSTERDPQVRIGAAQALARRADKSSIPAMYKALTDPEPEVRIWAITGIKNVTYTGFMYEASLPPQEQREVIQQIGAYLRKNGFM